MSHQEHLSPPRYCKRLSRETRFVSALILPACVPEFAAAGGAQEDPGGSIQSLCLFFPERTQYSCPNKLHHLCLTGGILIPLLTQALRSTRRGRAQPGLRAAPPCVRPALHPDCERKKYLKNCLEDIKPLMKNIRKQISSNDTTMRAY